MATVEIALDPQWQLLVKTGSKVSFRSSFAQIDGPQPQSQSIRLAKILKFSPEKIFSYLKKGVGEMVHKGDVIAENKTLFSTKRYLADSEGMITLIDHVTGEITFEQILPENSQANIMGMIEGVVGSVTKGYVQIKVAKALEVEVTTATPGRIGAPVIVTDNTQATLLTAPQVAATVIVGDELNEYVLSKLEALQVLAFVTPYDIESHVTHLTLKKKKDLEAIIDFAPTGVYANAFETHLTFYK